MSKVENKCDYCGNVHFIELGEYTYWSRRGRTKFFCSRSCSAKYNNQSRKTASIERTLTCPVCNKQFITNKPYEVTFCSRSCASKGSLTEHRLQRMSDGGRKSQSKCRSSAKSIQTLLKKREDWKYANLRQFLDCISECYEFEYLLDDYVFDLALPNKKLLIEFDGEYHRGCKQSEIDKRKSSAAVNSGWEVIRLSTKNDEVIDAKILIPIFARYQSN